MNYLISAYSVNPYHGSEDGVGWNWVLQYEKNYKPGDRIILLTKRFNEEDTRKGMKEFGVIHTELVITDVPMFLNWFREKYSMFHHMYYILWQHWAWLWVKKSGIKFDVIHHVTMGDYRIPGEMYKAKSARTILGPVGGAQTTPKSLKIYEKNKIASHIRKLVNISCSINPFYKKKIKAFTDVILSNGETYQQIVKIRGTERTFQIVELGLSDEYKNIQLHNKNGKFNILYAGRFIDKKGIIFLIEAISMLKGKIDFQLNLCGGGPLLNKILQLIKYYQLNDCVKICGEKPYNEMLVYYKEADIFVMPSLRETGGTVLIEAMAFGLPIVAFDTSFCSQLKEKNCGIFIETNQNLDAVKKDFVNAIINLYQNKELIKELGNNGYFYVNNELTWSEKFRKLYS